MIFIFGYLLLNFFVIYTDCPVWNYDGSSTYQADGSNSDIYLHPVALYKDPFLRDQNNVLVLCDTYNHERIPTGHYILNCTAIDLYKLLTTIYMVISKNVYGNSGDNQ